jgi:hypothetical protein
MCPAHFSHDIPKHTGIKAYCPIPPSADWHGLQVSNLDPFWDLLFDLLRVAVRLDCAGETSRIGV